MTLNVRLSPEKIKSFKETQPREILEVSLAQLALLNHNPLYIIPQENTRILQQVRLTFLYKPSSL